MIAAERVRGSQRGWAGAPAKKGDAFRQGESHPSNRLVQQLLAGKFPASLQVERATHPSERAAEMSAGESNQPHPGVRIQADQRASNVARSFGARALTLGDQVFVGQGERASGNLSSNRLLAHELAHVGQQRADGRLRLQLARLADFVDANPVHDPGRLTDAQIEATNEYRAYMNPALIWQTAFKLTANEARLACQLIVEAKRAGAPVDWAADARPFAERARAQLSVEKEAAGLEHKKMTWHPSGPAPNTDFARWALVLRPKPPLGPPGPPKPPAVLAAEAETEARAELPAVANATVLNCWEMVVLAAYRDHKVSWKWIHDIYSSPAPGWYVRLVDSLSRPARREYKRSDPNRPFPLAGDIVFFDGASHVALATGRHRGAGQNEVISFWPPPKTAFTPGGTLDEVKITTIEDLAEWMRVTPGFGEPKVEIANPPW